MTFKEHKYTFYTILVLISVLDILLCTFLTLKLYKHRKDTILRKRSIHLIISLHISFILLKIVHIIQITLSTFTKTNHNVTYKKKKNKIKKIVT